MVRSLLKGGAKVDARDKYGLTALHKVFGPKIVVSDGCSTVVRGVYKWMDGMDLWGGVRYKKTPRCKPPPGDSSSFDKQRYDG